MLSRIQSLGCCLIVFTLLLFAGSAAAQDVSARCEAAMDRAAGHYSKCLLSADAHYARHENATKLANRQARCETRFDRRTSRAINRHGADACPSSDLVAAMEDRTVTYAEGAASEAGGTPAPSLLFVQDGTGGTLSETTLTLTDVSSKTGWFTDRPYRGSGQMSTEEFIALWDEGETFADDPPNADFTCTVDSEVVNYVVELTSPGMAGEDLSYSAAAVGDTVLPETQITCDADSHMFIDAVSTIAGQIKQIQYNGCVNACMQSGQPISTCSSRCSGVVCGWDGDTVVVYNVETGLCGNPPPPPDPTYCWCECVITEIPPGKSVWCTGAACAFQGTGPVSGDCCIGNNLQGCNP